ncbi:MAG: F-box protein [Parachlamydiaceae bacterium]|nr:F-box protein [Parachlamydiaceae bacterium]
MNINHLSNELMLKIFSNFDVKELMIVQLVSKQFNLIANDNSLWRKFAKIREIENNFDSKVSVKKIVLDYAYEYIQTIGPLSLLFKLKKTG